MTLNEAILMAGICSTADDECPSCASALADHLTAGFPQFEWCFDKNHEPMITVKERKDQ